MNAADSWAEAGTQRSSAREGLKSSYGVGIVNLILSINITCRYRHSKFLPSDDSCQHRTWERVQAASENESSGNARENLTRWLRRWRQELYQQEYRNFRNIWCYAEPNGLLLVLNMLVGWQTQMLRSLNKWLGCVPRQKKLFKVIETRSQIFRALEDSHVCSAGIYLNLEISVCQKCGFVGNDN